ncbi:UNVERIFIED_CONTAM: hypothetical protein FKN15_051949 [Acipenser sinensis]
MRTSSSTRRTCLCLSQLPGPGNQQKFFRMFKGPKWLTWSKRSRVVRRVSHAAQVHVLAVRSRPVFTGDSEESVVLAQALPWVKELKPAWTVSPHRCPANPAGQAPSELSADTCGAGLCPPDVSSSLTSALEFQDVKEEAGLIVGSEDAH